MTRIVHDAFKQFERDKFSLVAQKYDEAIAAVTSQVNEAILDAVGAKCGNSRFCDASCRLQTMS